MSLSLHPALISPIILLLALPGSPQTVAGLCCGVGWLLGLEVSPCKESACSPLLLKSLSDYLQSLN